MPRLTKSLFRFGIECPLKMWNHVYRRDLLPSPSLSEQSRFETGKAVGKLAQQLFPNFVNAGAPESVENAISHSKEVMENRHCFGVFEATIGSGQLLTRCDVLANCEGVWDLWEVKSSTKINPEHLADVWFQQYVALQAGLNLGQVGVIHLDSGYAFDGLAIDSMALLCKESVISQIAELDDTLGKSLPPLVEVIESTIPPVVKMGLHCRDCEYFNNCSTEKPTDWIFQLPRISKKKWDELSAFGVESISKIPGSYQLTAAQKVVCDSVKTGVEYVSAELAEILNGVIYPLYFLDFEAFSEAIPRYKGCHPYEQIPFQWSCHVLQQDGSLSHREFLHIEDNDPRERVTESLLECLEGTNGTIVHYYSFERARISGLTQTFPSREVALKSLIGRLFDLGQVISKHYYHTDFRGSFSIKSVLPALVPALSYDDLGIHEGDVAAILYLRMIDPKTPANEKKAIRESLLDYCKRDTLGMVEIWKRLLGKVGS